MVASSLLALLVATWPLWTPQAFFPQVPLFSWFVAIPVGAEWLGCGLLWLSALGLLVSPPERWPERVSLAGLLVGFVFLVAVDQHRLQPWAWQFALLSVVFLTAGRSTGLRLARLLVISLYLFSAASKLDYAFTQELGPLLWRGLLRNFGGSLESLSPTVQTGLALTFPLAELAVGLGLCFPTARRIALPASMLMHVMLILAVGPTGLNHKPGVVIWNLYFIAQNFLLFGPVKRGESAAETTESRPSRSEPVAVFAVVLAAVLPLLEPWGGYDTWLAWGLYASRNERTEVFLHRDDAGELPQRFARYLQRTDQPQWLRLRIDRWSLEELGAPVYPQNRFQLGVAAGIALRFPFSHPVRAVLHSKAGLLSGQRRQAELVGRDAMKRKADTWWFGGQPRDNLYRFDRL